MYDVLSPDSFAVLRKEVRANENKREEARREAKAREFGDVDEEGEDLETETVPISKAEYEEFLRLKRQSEGS